VRSLPLAGLLASFAILAIPPAPAHAEYRRVEMKIFGMDCATCAHGIRIGMEKIDGVESAEISLERASADIKMRPDNHVSLEQFRKLVKFNGFAPKEATVTARGTVVDRGGKPAFQVSGIDSVLIVVPGKSATSAYKQLADALAAKKTGTLEITGTVQKKNDGSEEIIVTSVQEAQ
jgi:cation transport ATPase